MPLSVSTKTLVPNNQPYPPDVGTAPRSLRNAKRTVAPQAAVAFEDTAQALEYIQSNVDSINKQLRQNKPAVTDILVVDAAGRTVAAIGTFIFPGSGVPATNYFSEIHVGDPLLTGDPNQSLFNAADGRVTIGQNGWIDVLDPFGADAAWIGTQFDTSSVTGAANNGSGLIRLTIVGHTLSTGDQVIVQNVGGVDNATGLRTVTKIDANHIDLQNTVFVGPYTSGGTVTRLLHITNAVNDAGLIKITTAVPHLYESGDKVNITPISGVPNATGQWIVIVTSSTSFDLVGSTFAGAYVSGGTCIRYFGGMLAQTIAIGPSFANYNLREFADGTLRIRNASIEIFGTGASIIIDPMAGSITITQTGGGIQTVIQDGFIQQQYVDSGGVVDLTNSADLIEPGLWQMFAVGLTTFALSRVIDINGYTAATGNGPLLSLAQYRGIPTAATATQSGDIEGGVVTFGYDGVGESQNAGGIEFVATQAHTIAAHGTKCIIEVTANGNTSPSTGLTVDQDSTLLPGGDVNLPSGKVYKVNGTKVLGARQIGWSLPTNTLSRATFDTTTVTLPQLAARVGALLTDLFTQGEIGV